MMDVERPMAFERLVERIDPTARLIDARPLSGGVSADVMLLLVEDASRTRARLVVRRHGAVDFAADPWVAHNEFQLLRTLARQRIKAPKPIAVDDGCDLFPTPVIVVEFIEGEAVLEPTEVTKPHIIRQVADELRRIHETVAVDDLPFLSPLGSGISAPPSTPDELMRESEIRAALDATWPLAPIRRPALLHGDFWPGNWLWRDGQLVGVIDWEDARIGDPLADLGNARLETLFFFGDQAMEDLTRRYLGDSSADDLRLAYWDLRAALRPCGKLHRFGLRPDIEQSIRDRHRAFVDTALHTLGFRL